MPGSSTRLSRLQFLDALDRELQAHPVHTNPFFEAFQRGVTREQLRRFIRQWYTFGIRFRKILIGLLYNLSDKDEAIGLELMRVLYSEYGGGGPGEGDAEPMFVRVGCLGVQCGTPAPARACTGGPADIGPPPEHLFCGALPSPPRAP